MTTVSIQFDPATTEQATLVSMIARIYGTTSVAATPAAATGDEAPEAGETSADPSTIDKNGVPHDPRIHSAKPTMTDKGVWRKRKGVDDITFNSVSNELRARVGGAAPAPVASPAPAGMSPLPTLAPLGTPAPAAPPVRGAYETFVDFCAQNTNSADNPTGRLTPEWIEQSLAGLGIPGGIVGAKDVEPARIKAIHAQFAQALGLPAPV